MESVIELNPKDRYSIASHLERNAIYIIHYQPNKGIDNGAQDMGDRTIEELTKLGVQRNILVQGIHIFYRDYPSILDELETIDDGRDFLRELEQYVNRMD